MPKLEPRNMTHWLLLATLVLFWGMSFAITKMAVTNQSPYWTVAIRLAVGASLIWIILQIKGQTLPMTKQNWLWFGWLGLVGSLIPFLLISWGTQYISSGIAGILMAVIPLFIAISGHFILKDEPLTKIRLAGLAIGFLGLVILLSPAVTGGFPNGYRPLLAQLAVLLAAFSYGTQALTARLSPDMPPLQKAAGTHIAAATGAIALAIIFDSEGLKTISREGILLGVALGIFSTALAGIILFYLLEKAGAVFVSLSNYLLSPVALLIGIFFMGEPFHWISLLGLLVILAGIALSESKNPKG